MYTNAPAQPSAGGAVHPEHPADPPQRRGRQGFGAALSDILLSIPAAIALRIGG